MPRSLTPTRVADFRNRLCDVAMQLLLEEGYEGLNMRELASRLGVSAMTAYRYFHDKDEILAALRARVLNRLAGILEAACAAAEDPAARCAATSRAYVEFALNEPVYYRLIFDATSTSSEAVPELHDAETKLRTLLIENLAPMSDPAAPEAEFTAEVLWATLHGLAMLFFSRRMAVSDIEKVLTEALRLAGRSRTDLADACRQFATMRPEIAVAEHAMQKRHSALAASPSAG